MATTTTRGHDEPGIIGLDPTGTKAAVGAVASRPTTLEGAVVGLVSNRKGEATAFLEALHAELATLGVQGLGAPLLVEKDTVFDAPRPDDWERLTAGATVAITGFGG